MSKLLLVWVCLSTLAFSGEKSQLTIALQPSVVSDAVLREMQTEVSRLITPARWQINWIDVKKATETDHERIVVVGLRGVCKAEAMGGEFLVGKGTSLAATDVSDGRVLPFSRANCDALRKVLGQLLQGGSERDRSKIFGQALGRVIAHELYHVLGQTVHHEGAGVAKRCFSVSDLTAYHFEFASSTLASLRNPAVESETSETLDVAGGR